MPPRKTYRRDRPSSDNLWNFRKIKSLREINLADSVGIVGRYRLFKSRWVAERQYGVKVQELYCWLFCGAELVGAFHIYEFDCIFADDDDFCIIMDAESHSIAELADLVVQRWPEVSDRIFDYGTLVYIDRLAVASAQARRSEWAAVMRRVIEKEYPRHALLTLKAFPVDYEDLVRSGLSSSIRSGLRIRQLALMRLYSRALGVRTVPGKYGKMGWMFAHGPSFRRRPRRRIQL
ncbi:hypothetical protein [Bosea sp. (in: a-proteobacteria)]|uniref:hypothetical protein n=1 Tax=Bosea sp. (in: a-proteobacteria) TaxID=1871050 RepID=UPI002B48B5EB|nr:hypothetical protein [Bosea sp. (in: a-proteobacteria)]WRH56675.1 MAG: hypothetical protein RSE11_16735 [Bosea sp. (in: a-proteobacteria)]